MANVHCRNCGKTYRYIGDTCPHCGAYNRPPQREYVDADGTVRRVELSEKVCYEEKECHERKECHEGDARKVRGISHAGKKPLGFQVGEKSFTVGERNKPEKAPGHAAVRDAAAGKAAAVGTGIFNARRKATRGNPKAAAILGVVIALISFGISALENTDFHLPFVSHEPEVITEPGMYYSTPQMGETFQLGKDKLQVVRWTLAEDDPHLMLVWVRQPNQEERDAGLYCWRYDEENGYEDAYIYADSCFPENYNTCYVFRDIPFEGDYYATLTFYATEGDDTYTAEVTLKTDDAIAVG